MSVFLGIALSFPTVIFTVAVLGVVAYWLFVMLGLAEISGLDGSDSAAEGALDAVGEAVDGAIDGAEGAAEGAPTEATPGQARIAVGKVPTTVWLSAFALWGWVLAFALAWSVDGRVPLPPLLVSVGILALASALAAGLARVSVKPIESLFVVHTARERRSLVGEVCRISTGRVDDRFGQASAHVGADDLLVQVRCDGPNALRKGDLALIVHFDPIREAFVIEPVAGLRVDEGASERRPGVPEPSLS